MLFVSEPGKLLYQRLTETSVENLVNGTMLI